MPGQICRSKPKRTGAEPALWTLVGKGSGDGPVHLPVVDRGMQDTAAERAANGLYRQYFGPAANFLRCRAAGVATESNSDSGAACDANGERVCAE